MFLKGLGVRFGLLGTLLGASWGDLVPSWGEIGMVSGDFWGSPISMNLLE